MTTATLRTATDLYEWAATKSVDIERRYPRNSDIIIYDLLADASPWDIDDDEQPTTIHLASFSSVVSHDLPVEQWGEQPIKLEELAEAKAVAGQTSWALTHRYIDDVQANEIEHAHADLKSMF